MGKLTGKVALVTGGAGGIGQAVVKLLAHEGAQVVLNYRRSEGPTKGHRAMQADVSKAADVARLFGAIESAYGRLDVLVNNAGVNRDALLSELTEEMWDEVIATNLKGPFLCAKAAVPLMLRHGGGSIINIASESALKGRIGACNYTAAKGGLVALTKSLARELAPAIRVNCLALGLVETDELAGRLGHANLQRSLDEIPMRRLGTADEVARAVLFLACADSSYVTGQVLAVGGGRWM
jgi:3-oxoacyl-[acyl-carrier protein] reductase